MDETPALQNQENNQLLLNAIRNKFAAQNASEAAAFSPPKFTIPTLKTSGSGDIRTNKSLNDVQLSTVAATSVESKDATNASNLNQFILQQLQDKRTNSELNSTVAGFTLPTLLQTKSSWTTQKFTIPQLNCSSRSSSTNVVEVANGIGNLKMNDDNEVPATAIDLTAALSGSRLTAQITASARLEARRKEAAVVDFEIPFIDCDRPQILPPAETPYCETDVSNVQYQHNYVAPSALGRILCLSSKQLNALPYASSKKRLSVKHKIEPFAFDTKSPDDIILETLSKYQRHQK